MSKSSRAKPLNPRKIASQARAAATVAAIIEAAARILEIAGFDSYTTNAIADRAGVSVGSLYQYFPNKDAITLKLIERESIAVQESILQAAQIEDWENALGAMIDVAVNHQLRRPKLARLLDIAETRLNVSDWPADGIGSILPAVILVLNRASIDLPANHATVACDLVGITRGLTDMASRDADLETDSLRGRIHLAVFSYLSALSQKIVINA